MSTHDQAVALRPATSHDAKAVAEIWRTGWRDGHLGNVPDALLAIRPDESFDVRPHNGSTTR